MFSIFSFRLTISLAAAALAGLDAYQEICDDPPRIFAGRWDGSATVRPARQVNKVDVEIF